MSPFFIILTRDISRLNVLIRMLERLITRETKKGKRRSACDGINSSLHNVIQVIVFNEFSTEFVRISPPRNYVTMTAVSAVAEVKSAREYVDVRIVKASSAEFSSEWAVRSL